MSNLLNLAVQIPFDAPESDGEYIDVTRHLLAVEAIQQINRADRACVKALQFLADADPELGRWFLTASETYRRNLPLLVRELAKTAEETKGTIATFSARTRAERIRAGHIDPAAEKAAE